MWIPDSFPEIRRSRGETANPRQGKPVRFRAAVRRGGIPHEQEREG